MSEIMDHSGTVDAVRDAVFDSGVFETPLGRGVNRAAVALLDAVPESAEFVRVRADVDDTEAHVAVFVLTPPVVPTSGATVGTDQGAPPAG